MAFQKSLASVAVAGTPEKTKTPEQLGRTGRFAREGHSIGHLARAYLRNVAEANYCNRHRLFGRKETCWLPDEALSARIIGVLTRRGQKPPRP